MEFRTQLPIKQFPFQLNHDNNILCLGSCFAETIGNYLSQFKFKVSTNPLGTIFNPIAISNVINWGIKPFDFDKNLVTTKEGRFTHFMFHSDIYGNTIDELRSISQTIHKEFHKKLHNIDTLIITLGTAYCYKHLQTNTYVSNCHKVPQKEFSKELINIQTIKASLIESIQSLPKLKQTILTVSPVRHLKDSIELNSVSKSTLRLATHQLSTHNKNIHYFPSYEIMLDDLRDYRFFKEDMIHPTEQAKQYICEHFSISLFSKDTRQTNQRIQKIKNAVNHRPFNPSSAEHQNFIQKTIADIKQIGLDFSEELQKLSNQII